MTRWVHKLIASFAAAVVCSAGILARTPDDVGPKPILITHHFVTVDKVRLHYVESGKGRPIVLIHGNAGDVQDFEMGTIQELASQYRVIAVDRPGHGSSDRPVGAGSVEYQAAWLHD